MKNFKSLGEIYCKQLQKAVSLKSPEWNKVKCLMADKESPHVFFIKYIHYETSFVPFVSASGSSIWSSYATLRPRDKTFYLFLVADTHTAQL